MIPFFKVKEVPPEERLSPILKKARERAGLSLQEAESKTKIRAKYLKALEEGQYNKLPADVYVRGFLQAYCRLLNLNYQKIVQLYNRERGIHSSLQKIKEPQMPKPIRSPKIIITPKTIIIGGLILAFLLISGYIWYQFSKFTSPPTLEIIYPQNNLQVDTNSIVVEGKTDPVAELFINEQAISINPDGTFKTLISLQQGVNLIKFSAKNKLGKETVIERQIMATFKLATKEPPKEKEESSEKIQLTLTIGPDSAWIHITSDGKLAYQGVMLPGTSQSFEATESIVLTTGNAGSTQVTFNGKNVGKLGKPGEVKREIRFDKNTKIE